jgi:predicted NBD/HSP70 family sugar kinase
MAALESKLDELATVYGDFGEIRLSIAGNVDSQRATLIGAGNLTHWVGKPFVATLRKRYDCPIVVANDCVAFAAATALYEQPLPPIYLAVIWGTGIGMCFVNNADATPVPYQGEGGHLPVVFGGSHMRRCKCGQWNCLEAFAGGAAIESRYGKEAKDLSDDEWHEVQTWMVMGLRSPVTILKVPHIIIGGGVACNQLARINELQAMLADDLNVVAAPTIAISRFGETAGLAGAFALGGVTLL